MSHHFAMSLMVSLSLDSAISLLIPAAFNRYDVGKFGRTNAAAQPASAARSVGAAWLGASPDFAMSPIISFSPDFMVSPANFAFASFLDIAGTFRFRSPACYRLLIPFRVTLRCRQLFPLFHSIADIPDVGEFEGLTRK